VVFQGGLPVLRRRPAGAAVVQPWTTPLPPLPLPTPGRAGEDCLRLRFRIDAGAQLILEGEDLRDEQPIGPLCLGPVR